MHHAIAWMNVMMNCRFSIIKSFVLSLIIRQDEHFLNEIALLQTGES